MLIGLIMGAMYGGFGTPSEVAGVGAGGAFILGVALGKGYQWADLRAIFTGTAKERCMGMMIIAQSFLLSSFWQSGQLLSGIKYL